MKSWSDEIAVENAIACLRDAKYRKPNTMQYLDAAKFHIKTAEQIVKELEK